MHTMLKNFIRHTLQYQYQYRYTPLTYLYVPNYGLNFEPLKKNINEIFQIEARLNTLKS
jgi:hypothetical protein